MSEATPEDLDRMTKSRRVLHGWEQGGMTGRPEDNARMIREEIAVLDGLAQRYPVKADTLGKLIDRYRELLGKVEAG
jgi:hypothetical protein